MLRRRSLSSTLLISLAALYALYALYCYTNDMPLLSTKLPKYSGPYAVGTIDLELLCERRNISDAILVETGRPAFELETVLFTLFYPAVRGAASAKPKHPWLPDPSQHGRGYARFARMSNAVTDSVFSAALWTLAGSTTIPAAVDVPLDGSHLHRAPDHPAHDDLEKILNDNALPKFPLIIFSHGMASSRTSYTQWCGELASRGHVVAAIEHRDGSGPGTSVMKTDGTPARDVFHISASALSPEPSTAELKAMQLAMRQAEVEETVRALRLIDDGFGPDLYHLNPRREGTDLAEWAGRLDFGRVVMAGHSYGATLALQALNGAPTFARPFAGGIALDPGKESGPLNDDVAVPLLVIHSQSWSARHSVFFGRPHFDVVKALVQKALARNGGRTAWFLTAKGTSHPSVTDAPLIEPSLLSWTTGSTIDNRDGVLIYVKAAAEFTSFLATGVSRGVLAEPVSHPSYNEDVRDEKRKKQTSAEVNKFWQIHVAPKRNEAE